MTFEKWFESYAPTAPESLDDCALAAFQAGAASRDAEIDQLRAELEYDQRNAAMSQSESARLLDENTKLRAELVKALAACKVNSGVCNEHD